MSWTDAYRPELDLNPDSIPVLRARVVDDDHWSVTCPDCGRVNTHSAGPGHRSAHCACDPEPSSRRIGGYVIAPPGAAWVPYADHCRACGLSAGFFTPIDIEPSEHRRGIVAGYVCDRSHGWETYWGDRPYGPVRNVSPDGHRRCALYRHFDESDTLLYVGVSDNPVQRGKGHAAASAWVRYAVRMEGQWFATRVDAERAERAAIRAEVPVFNVAHALPGAEDRIRRYLSGRGGDAW